MASSSSSPASSPKFIKLKTRDNQFFQVEETAISMSQTIKYVIEEDTEAVIPLPNVTGRVMMKVVEYCRKHDEESRKRGNRRTSAYERKTEESALEKWDEEFVKGFIDDQEMLFDVVMAANYLDISGLLDLTCKSIAGLMKGRSPEEIREIFHIKNDYTKEEEEEIRRENAWAF